MKIKLKDLQKNTEGKISELKTEIGNIEQLVQHYQGSIDKLVSTSTSNMKVRDSNILLNIKLLINTPSRYPMGSLIDETYGINITELSPSVVHSITKLNNYITETSKIIEIKNFSKHESLKSINHYMDKKKSMNYLDRANTLSEDIKSMNERIETLKNSTKQSEAFHSVRHIYRSNPIQYAIISNFVNFLNKNNIPFNISKFNLHLYKVKYFKNRNIFKNTLRALKTLKTLKGLDSNINVLENLVFFDIDKFLPIFISYTQNTELLNKLQNSLESSYTEINKLMKEVEDIDSQIDGLISSVKTIDNELSTLPLTRVKLVNYLSEAYDAGVLYEISNLPEYCEQQNSLSETKDKLLKLRTTMDKLNKLVSKIKSKGWKHSNSSVTISDNFISPSMDFDFDDVNFNSIESSISSSCSSSSCGSSSSSSCGSSSSSSCGSSCGS